MAFVSKVSNLFSKLFNGLVLFSRFYRPQHRLASLKRKEKTQPISSHLDLRLGQQRIYCRLTFAACDLPKIYLTTLKWVPHARLNIYYTRVTRFLCNNRKEMGNLGRFFSLKYHDELSYSTTKHKFKEVSEDSKNFRNQEITLLPTNYNFEYLTFCRREFSSHWLTFKVYFLVFHFLSFTYSSSRSIYFFVQDPKPLEVYSADFVIDGPQLGFLGNVSSSFPFSLFF